MIDYEIDTRRAVIRCAAILRSRPRLEKWQTEFDIIYDDRFVSEAILVETLERAGVVVGLGDFRPARNGPFGRFNVELR